VFRILWTVTQRVVLIVVPMLKRELRFVGHVVPTLYRML